MNACTILACMIYNICTYLHVKVVLASLGGHTDNGETQPYDSTTAAECMKATFQWQEKNLKGSELQQDPSPSPKEQLERREDSWVLRAPTLILGQEVQEVQQETGATGPGTKVAHEACIETTGHAAAATIKERTTQAPNELEKAALHAETQAMEDFRNGLVAKAMGEEPKEPPHVPANKNNMVNGRVLPEGWCNIPFLTPAEQKPKAAAKGKPRGKAKAKSKASKGDEQDLDEAPKGRNRKADPSNREQDKPKQDVEVPEAPKGRKPKAKASKPEHVEVPEEPKGRKPKAKARKPEQSEQDKPEQDVEVPEAPKGRKPKAKASKPEQDKPEQDVEVPEARKGRKRKADPSNREQDKPEQDVEVPEAPKGRKPKAKASKPEQDKPKKDVEVPEAPEDSKRKADPSNLEQSKAKHARGGASKDSKYKSSGSKGEDKDEEQKQKLEAERKARYSRKSCAYKKVLNQCLGNGLDLEEAKKYAQAVS